MTKFVADVHLGKLARLLRLLGFDTVYSNSCTKEELLHTALTEERVLLSRNPAFKKQYALRSVIINSEEPEEQVNQVIGQPEVRKEIRPFTRCLRCNGRLQPVAKETALPLLEENTRLYYHEFWQCDSCDQLYWKGPHYNMMMNTLRRLGILPDDR